MEISPISYEAGEGLFLRDDAQEIPDSILEDTEEKLYEIYEDLAKFNLDDYSPEEIPKSVGHYFNAQFQKWLKVTRTQSVQV